MLRCENRLKKRKEFGYIYKNGSCVHSRYLTLLYTASKLKKVRVGFSVSKKVGKAFMRNKIKRRLRAIVRERIAQLPPNANYIFLAKPDIVNIGFLDIDKEVQFLINKLGEKINENHK
ncbi:MAG: ribonuclease P protein component [Clostridia bacterium]|nr:ribonuclease P protein component [Clostridia bacterium]